MVLASTIRRRSVVALCLAAVAAVAASLVAGPVLASPEERRVDRARDRLQEVRAELEGAREARDAEAEALEVAERRVEEVLDAVGEAELAVERQEAAVAMAEERLDAAEDEALRHEERTGARIADLYRRGSAGLVDSVLAATSPGELLARSSYLDAVNRTDRRGFEEVVAARVAVDAEATHVEEERQRLERVLGKQQKLLAEVEELREDQAVALAEQEQELERLESHEAHLAAESRELARVAQWAAHQGRDDTSRASRSGGDSGDDSESSAPSGGGGGGWTWPANGTVTSEYGQRWGRLHAGIDIAGPHGSAVTAARGGTVSHAGSMGGYGNIVMVDHGGGITTAYAHLSTIEVGVGTQVSAGQRIGGMGCTGSCTGTHLHFEVRTGGNPQNPRGYLP